MNVIDLSHVIEPGMSVFPGDPEPSISILWDFGSGATSRVSGLSICAHTGTHVDCGSHVFPQGAAVDEAEPEMFVGPGAVVDCTGVGPNEEIPVEAFYGLDLSKFRFLLVYCGFCAHWNTPAFFGDYPVLSKNAVCYLSGFENLVGIGVESPSIDPVNSVKLERHNLWLKSGKNRCIVENLTNLDRLLGREFLFCALPLKLKGVEASPVRAVALVE